MKDIYKKLLKDMRDNPPVARNQNDRVLIVDGLNTFIRSWTVTPTMNENGDHTGGITGTLKSIGYAIKQTNPTRVVVVFDGKDGSKKRRKKFSGYKEGRKSVKQNLNRQYPEMMTEEDERESMKRQLLWLIDVLDSLPVTTMIYDGIEADDVMAYIARHCLEEHEQAVLMSSDKDFLQLVDESTIVWSPTKKKLYNVKKVIEEYKIHPKNLLIYRAMDGDKSDNIAGIRGIGHKTLLKRFPQITSEDKIKVNEIVEYAEERKDEYAVYKTVSESKDQFLLNSDLMQLEEPQIGTHNKLNISNRFDNPVRKFNKMNFIKVAMKYKMLQNWSDVNGWLHDCFGGLSYDT